MLESSPVLCWIWRKPPTSFHLAECDESPGSLNCVFWTLCGWVPNRRCANSTPADQVKLLTHCFFLVAETSALCFCITFFISSVKSSLHFSSACLRAASMSRWACATARDTARCLSSSKSLRNWRHKLHHLKYARKGQQPKISRWK